MDTVKVYEVGVIYEEDGRFRFKLNTEFIKSKRFLYVELGLAERGEWKSKRLCRKAMFRMARKLKREEQE